jgi:hypothetical protein
MVRYVPELQMNGVWISDLDLGEGASVPNGESNIDSPRVSRLELPFSIEAA